MLLAGSSGHDGLAWLLLAMAAALALCAALLPAPTPQKLTDAAFSPDGSRVAARIGADLVLITVNRDPSEWIPAPPTPIARPGGPFAFTWTGQSSLVWVDGTRLHCASSLGQSSFELAANTLQLVGGATCAIALLEGGTLVCVDVSRPDRPRERWREALNDDAGDGAGEWQIAISPGRHLLAALDRNRLRIYSAEAGGLLHAIPTRPRNDVAPIVFLQGMLIELRRPDGGATWRINHLDGTPSAMTLGGGAPAQVTGHSLETLRNLAAFLISRRGPQLPGQLDAHWLVNRLDPRGAASIDKHVVAARVLPGTQLQVLDDVGRLSEARFKWSEVERYGTRFMVPPPRSPARELLGLVAIWLVAFVMLHLRWLWIGSIRRRQSIDGVLTAAIVVGAALWLIDVHTLNAVARAHGEPALAAGATALSVAMPLILVGLLMRLPRTAVAALCILAPSAWVTP